MSKKVVKKPTVDEIARADAAAFAEMGTRLKKDLLFAAQITSEVFGDKAAGNPQVTLEVLDRLEVDEDGEWTDQLTVVEGLLKAFELAKTVFGIEDLKYTFWIYDREFAPLDFEDDEE